MAYPANATFMISFMYLNVGLCEKGGGGNRISGRRSRGLNGHVLLCTPLITKCFVLVAILGWFELFNFVLSKYNLMKF